MDILSVDAINFLNNAVGDLDAYIKKTIEAQVNMNKSPDRIIIQEQVNEPTPIGE